MFLKTESFEHNGVTVTLSELSALQRIEHLALMKRQNRRSQTATGSLLWKTPSEPVLLWWLCPCGITIRRRQSSLP